VSTLRFVAGKRIRAPKRLASPIDAAINRAAADDVRRSQRAKPVRAPARLTMCK
jgi:hypothetical protein